MRDTRRLVLDDRTISLALAGLLLLVLCVAGGASRATEMGQVIVRAFAIVAMIILCVTRRTWTVAGVGWPLAVIAFVAAIAIVQLVPLPPALWTALPGRAAFEAAISDGPQPWRPINLTPDAGLNALLSLVVPTAMLTILVGVGETGRRAVVNLLLAVVLITAFLGSLQLAGATFNNPFINETVGFASGVFANRNHQALLLACGLPLLCAWASSSAGDRQVHRVRWLAAAGMMIWLLLLILATGSRAGIVLAALGLVAAGVSGWRALRHVSGRWPRRRTLVVVAALAVSAVGTIIAVGMASDRALALSRLLSSGEQQDFRTSSLPVSWELITRYFPFGSGLGSFDPVFRIVEPLSLLSPLYHNHAHNDPVEMLIEAGAMGALLIGFALFVWGRLGVTAWRDARAEGVIGLTGWWMMTLILAASLVDYPLRTPLVMVVAAVAAWLAQWSDPDGRSVPALPS